MNEINIKLFLEYLKRRDYEKAQELILDIYDKDNIDYLPNYNFFMFLLSVSGIFSLGELEKDYVHSLTVFDYTPAYLTKCELSPIETVKINAIKHKFQTSYYMIIDNDIKIKPYEKEVLLILLELAIINETKETNTIYYLTCNKEYLKAKEYLEARKEEHALGKNMLLIDILLSDILSFTKSGTYTPSITCDSDNYFDQITSKNYEVALDMITKYNIKDNIKLQILINLLKEVINLTKTLPPKEDVTSKEWTNKESDMFIDFLIEQLDVINEEGLILLNPESDLINEKMSTLTFAIPSISSYIIGDNPKQVLIIPSKDDKLDQNYLKELLIEEYTIGNYEKVILISKDILKCGIPSGSILALIGISYIRMGSIHIGIKYLKSAIGNIKYNDKKRNKKTWLSLELDNIIYYYTKRDEKLQKEENQELTM